MTNELATIQVTRMMLHGESPLDELLKVMRYYGKVFDRVSAKIDPAESLPEDAKPEDMAKAKAQRDYVKEVAAFVSDVANKAAPFLHARLSAVENTPKIDPSKLTPEEIAIVVPILRKCAARPSDPVSGPGTVAPVGSGSPGGAAPTTHH